VPKKHVRHGKHEHDLSVSVHEQVTWSARCWHHINLITGSCLIVPHHAHLVEEESAHVPRTMRNPIDVHYEDDVVVLVGEAVAGLAWRLTLGTHTVTRSHV
jgi:hypothetical protein